MKPGDFVVIPAHKRHRVQRTAADQPTIRLEVHYGEDGEDVVEACAKAKAAWMSVRGNRLYVELSASQVRRRLKGHGFGVRKVESAGRNRAAIIHTATGEHRRELEALFGDVLSSTAEKPERE